MSRYVTYKPSGIDWIGEVPIDWKVKRVKDFFSILGGNGFPDDEQGNETGDIPFLKVSDINSDDYRVYSSSNYVSNETVLKKGWNVIPANSIVMGKIGEALKKNHRKINTVDCLIDNNMMALQPLPKVNIKFSYYLLSIVDMDWFTNPGTIPAVSTVALKSSKVTLPSPSEQLTIANYLDDQTQKIDRLIANKKAQAEKLKELRQIEINNAVTKGLNPNAEMKDSGIEWLGKIPKHWELKKIKQLLKPEKNAIKTGPFGSDLKFEDLIEEGIKVYNQRSVLDNDWKSGEGYISAEKYESLKTCTIFPDDIVITTRGTIGKVSIFPADAELGILHPCLMRIQMNSQRILNDYLKIIINDSSFFFEALKLASNATTIDVIYSDSLKEVKIPDPPTNEQVEITTYLQKKVSAIDQLIKNIEAQIEKLQELRKIKIYEAVTGKIKVNAYAETTA